MKKSITLLALITLLAFARKENTITIDFLQGTWKIEQEEDYEAWEKVNDKELKGTSYKIRSGKKITAEYLAIKVHDGKTVYTAIVPNQNSGLPVDFILNTTVKGKLSFENPAHDFPKKIQYTKIDEKTLFVEVLGDGDKGFSYKMFKQ